MKGTILKTKEETNNKENKLYLEGRTKKLEYKKGMYFRLATWIEKYIVFDEKEEKFMDENERREATKKFKMMVDRYFEDFSNIDILWNVDQPYPCLLSKGNESDDITDCILIDKIRKCEYFKKQRNEFKKMRNCAYNAKAQCLCYLVRLAKNKYFYNLCFDDCMHYLSVVSSGYLDIIKHNIVLYDTALLYEIREKEFIEEMEKQGVRNLKSETEEPDLKLKHKPCVEP